MYMYMHERRTPERSREAHAALRPKKSNVESTPCWSLLPLSTNLPLHSLFHTSSNHLFIHGAFLMGPVRRCGAPNRRRGGEEANEKSTRSFGGFNVDIEDFLRRSGQQCLRDVAPFACCLSSVPGVSAACGYVRGGTLSSSKGRTKPTSGEWRARLSRLRSGFYVVAIAVSKFRKERGISNEKKASEMTIEAIVPVMSSNKASSFVVLSPRKSWSAFDMSRDLSSVSCSDDGFGRGH